MYKVNTINIRITRIQQIHTGLEKMTAQRLADGAWLYTTRS
jgi:glycyl-tRNA synthetase beta subunit